MWRIGERTARPGRLLGVLDYHTAAKLTPWRKIGYGERYCSSPSKGRICEEGKRVKDIDGRVCSGQKPEVDNSEMERYACTPLNVTSIHGFQGRSVKYDLELLVVVAAIGGVAEAVHVNIWLGQDMTGSNAKSVAMHVHQVLFV